MRVEGRGYRVEGRPQAVITSRVHAKRAMRDLRFRIGKSSSVAALVMTAGSVASAVAQSPPPSTLSPSPSYLAFVGSEGNDEISLIRFAPDAGAKVDHKFRMGTNPTELVGPHGV